MSDAIVLAGHGSRSAEANDAVVVLARSLASQLGIPVYPGFLEMSSPAIPDAFRAAHAAGATRIVLLPYFLLPGMHVRRDLTELADAGRAELGVSTRTTVASAKGTPLAANSLVRRRMSARSKVRLSAMRSITRRSRSR